MVNCFECIFCKRNGDKNPNVGQGACYCDCPDIANNYDYSRYCRVSTWANCEHWFGKEKQVGELVETASARNEGWCDGYDVGFAAAKKTILKKISEVTFTDTGE